MDIYLERFCKYDGPREFFPEFRELLCALSLRTFCGDYITEDQIALVADNYYRVTAAGVGQFPDHYSIHQNLVR